MYKLFESKYNIIEKMENPVGNFKYVIVNSFTGSIDVFGEHTMNILSSIRSGEFKQIDNNYLDFFIKRGYFYLKSDEEIRKIYAFKQATDNLNRSKNSIRVIILTTYECNLNCEYCYQRSINRSISSISLQGIKKIFEYIDNTRQQKPYRITIDVIGGEPLLNKKVHRKTIISIITECEKRQLKFRLISNGINLIHYIDILSKTEALEFIQITIDGPPKVQMLRRKQYGKSYIQDLIKGINIALERGLRIAARTNIDNDNIFDLKDLFGWYQQLGWANKESFYPYVSPVHDYSCSSCNNKFDEYQILYKLLSYEDLYPQIVSKFNKSNFLSYQYFKNPLRTRIFTFPRYYRCEANINQLVFDPKGLIYPCIEASGHEEYAVGNYLPEFNLYEPSLRRWREDRDITKLNICLECCICFICGGNCAWWAFNLDKERRNNQCDMLRESVKLLLRKRGHLLTPDGKKKKLKGTRATT